MIHLFPLSVQGDKRAPSSHSNLQKESSSGNNSIFLALMKNRIQFSRLWKRSIQLFTKLELKRKSVTYLPYEGLLKIHQFFFNIFFQFQERFLKFLQTFGDGWFRHNWSKVFLVNYSLDIKFFRSCHKQMHFCDQYPNFGWFGVWLRKSKSSIASQEMGLNFDCFGDILW